MEEIGALLAEKAGWAAERRASLAEKHEWDVEKRGLQSIIERQQNHLRWLEACLVQGEAGANFTPAAPLLLTHDESVPMRRL